MVDPKKEVVNWLKTKKNFLHYDSGKHMVFKDFFDNKLKEVLAEARSNIYALSSTPFYILKETENEISFDLIKIHPKKNFIDEVNKYIDYINIETRKNEFYRELKDMILYKIYWSEDEPVEFQNKFEFSMTLAFDIMKKEQKQETIDISSIKKSKSFYDVFKRINGDKDFDIDEYKNDILESSKEYRIILEEIDSQSEHKNIQTIGLFFPVKEVLNIFEHKNYLFEINKYKFLRVDNNTYSKIEDLLRKVINPYAFFQNYHGNMYRKDIAYFDPFILLDNDILKKKYKKFVNDLEDCEESKRVLLLEDLSLLKFFAVFNQQQLLFNATYARRSKNRKLSIYEMIEDDKNELGELLNKSVNQETDAKFKHLVLSILYEKYPINKTKKNITIDDFDIQALDYEITIMAKKILDNYMLIIGENNYSLKNIIKQDISIIKKAFKDNNIQLSKESKELIEDLVNYVFKDGEKYELKVSNSITKLFKKFFNLHKYKKEDLRKKMDVNQIDKLLGKLPKNAHHNIY